MKKFGEMVVIRVTKEQKEKLKKVKNYSEELRRFIDELLEGK
jgi:hypothetical protein